MENALIISNILLWIVVLVMGAVIFALVRQIGVLYERVAPAGALMMNKSLQVGMQAPAVNATTLRGEAITVGGKPASGRSQLVYFLSHDCPVCRSLLPALKSAASAEKEWLDIILASDGEHADHAKFAETQGLQEFNYVLSELLGVNYGVSKLPYGVLINEDGSIASLGIINSREHLDSLFEAKERKIGSIQDYMKQQSATDTTADNNEQLYTELPRS
jgi:methylamine dehydrogenase accessory protein MauD